MGHGLESLAPLGLTSGPARLSVEVVETLPVGGVRVAPGEVSVSRPVVRLTTGLLHSRKGTGPRGPDRLISTSPIDSVDV